MGGIFRRKIYDRLVEWKRISNGRTAALIEGARRVGKSTVSEQFAKDSYADYLLIDFSKESNDVKQLFSDAVGDLDTLFRNLFLLKGKGLSAGDAVIILDEVQLCPPARQAVKALVADGRYHYIETGSLISIKQNTRDILIPSEERKMLMFPMDFEEFCWARGDMVTADAIRDAFDARKPLGNAVHRKIMRMFCEYMAVGGMPQAVEVFVKGGTYAEIDYAKRSILDLYGDDLHKYDSDENGHVSAIFKSLSAQLGNRGGRFKYSVIGKGQRYNRLKKSLEFLDESMMVNFCTNVTDPDVLMEMYEDRGNFKLFMGDTGLLVTQASGRANDSLYKSLVVGTSGANMGMIFENAAAQMLVTSGHAAHFHEFELEDPATGRVRPYEIDFLIVRGRRICPVEVKSSGYKTHKSIDKFYEKYDVKAPERYVLYGKDVARDGEILYLPVYMAMCL